MMNRVALIAGGIVLAATLGSGVLHSSALEQRDDVGHLRGPYNIAFFHRHNDAFRIGAAIHFAHAKQHDVLLLSPLKEHEKADADFDAECVGYMKNPPYTEPTMEYFGPFTARVAWDLYRAIDWTHMHHEQTYDILASRDIPWEKKKEWTDRSVRYYLERLDIPRSPAPLDVTMRRAGVMMKPYFSVFRNKYPQSNNFFYAAHWWHPADYEAMMIAGQGDAQKKIVGETNRLFHDKVLVDRPQRMLLSREMMPRYSRMTPESANIFDNLHMLHGIAYDILAFEGWSLEEKRKELDRVIEAMSYQPGDEKLARKFETPYPDMDPRRYDAWMKGTEGDMNRIMKEMMEEMSPMMMPDATAEQKEQVQAQMKMKLKPGMQEGEHPGSLHDAVMKIVPDMKMMPESKEPGKTSKKMVDAMLQGWREKHGGKPDIEPYPMPSGQTADVRGGGR